MSVLKVVGSRDRKVLLSEGEHLVYRIRRLRCDTCSKLHHELPDVVVPYKRYSSEIIASVIDAPEDAPLNDTTIRRMHHWMDSQVHAFIASMMTVLKKYMGVDFVVPPHKLSPISRLKCLLCKEKNWLADLVRHLSNMNLWPQTRSVSLSG